MCHVCYYCTGQSKSMTKLRVTVREDYSESITVMAIMIREYDYASPPGWGVLEDLPQCLLYRQEGYIPNNYVTEAEDSIEMYE